jgi:hypothetical protein
MKQMDETFWQKPVHLKSTNLSSKLLDKFAFVKKTPNPPKTQTFIPKKATFAQKTSHSENDFVALREHPIPNFFKK